MRGDGAGEYGRGVSKKLELLHGLIGIEHGMFLGLKRIIHRLTWGICRRGGAYHETHGMETCDEFVEGQKRGVKRNESRPMN